MSLLNNFPHTCKQKRKRLVRQPLGGSLESDVTITRDLRCWVQNASSSDVAEFQKRDQDVTHKVFFTQDHSLRPEDVLVPDNGPFADKRLIVRASTERSAGTSIVWAAYCEEQRNEQPTSFR